MAREVKELQSGYISSNLQDILNTYKSINQSFIPNANRIHQVAIKGDLLTEMYLKADTLSRPEARKYNKDFAVSVNYLEKIVDAKTKIYTFDVTRTVANATEQALLDKLVAGAGLNTHMGNANQYFNASKSVLVELYLNRYGVLSVRPIPNSNFFVYSDDFIEPNLPTAYIKIIKSAKNSDGKTVDILHIYTDTEFMIVTTDSKVQRYIENIWGVAPFTYINKEAYELYPTLDMDSLQNVININAIETNAVVCTFYQGHPVRWIKNFDKKKSSIDINPDAILILNGVEGSDRTPEIGEMGSSLDPGKATALATHLLNNVLFKHDINPKDAVQTGSSGIALQLKDINMLENRKAQIEIFTPAEQELLYKMCIMHNVMVQEKLGGAKTPVGTFNINKDFAIEVEYQLPDAAAEVQNEDAPADDSAGVS